MSGPKAIDIWRAQWAEERRQNEYRCAIFASAYQRLAAELESLESGLADLGLSSEFTLLSGDEMNRQIGELLRQGHHEQAIQSCEQQVEAARLALATCHERLKERIAHLQARFRDYAGEREALAQECSRLESIVLSGVPAEWPEADQQSIIQLAQQIKSRIVLPQPVPTALALPAIRQLEQGESLLAQAQKILTEGKGQIGAEFNQVHARHLLRQLQTPARESPSLADFLQSMAAPARESSDDGKLLKQLDQLVAAVADLRDTGGWIDLMSRGEAIRNEPEAPRRRMLYEALVLDCSQRLKQLRAVARWRTDIDDLIDQAAPLKGTAVDAVVLELEALSRAGRLVPLGPWQQRLERTMAGERNRLDREEKRRAILESLRELGYETREGLETAFVQGGKLVVHKPDEDEYAVELVGNPDLSLLQTAMVRHAESEDLTEQQRLRDREREEAWCQDHTRLRQKLAARGLEARFKAQHPPGAHPVKIIVDKERAQSRQKELSDEARRQQRATPE